MEGGRPGSETAGVVAFIRERLVQVDEDGENAEYPQAPGVSREIPYKGIPPSDTDDEFTADSHDTWKDVEQGSNSSLYMTERQLDEIPLTPVRRAITGKATRVS